MRSGLLRSDTDSRKDKLVAELSEVVAKAEDLLREAGSEVEDRLGSAKATLAEAGAAVSGKAKHAADVTDEYVRANPWKVLAVAAAAGALIGIVLMSRR